MSATPTEIASRALADHLAALPAAELLTRYARRRDPEAFAGLVRQFGPMVLGVCRRVLDSSTDAEDAFQAVFLALARQATSFRDATALPAWLHRVALRTARKALARRDNTAPLPDAVPDPSDPLANVAWKDVRRVLDEELDALPTQLRGPVVLCWLDGLTQDEAAGRLGFSLNTLKRRLDAGRELLRARLTRRGLAPVLVASAVLDPTGLRAVLPDSLALLAVEHAWQGAAVPSGVEALAVFVAATASGRNYLKAGLALVLVAGVVTAGVVALSDKPPPSTPPDATANGQPNSVEVAPMPRIAPVPAKPRIVPRTRMTGYVRGTELWWSPDGKSIATITADPKGENEQITVWDVETSAVRTALGKYAKGDGILTLAFSPDGATIAAGHDGGTIRFWDLVTGKEKEPIRGLAGRVSLLAWSPDSKTLAFQAGQTVTFWDIDAKKARGRGVEFTDKVTVLEFSPDSKSLASLSNKWDPHNEKEQLVTVNVWDVATGQPRSEIGKELRAAEFGVYSDILRDLHRTYRAVVWSSDGKFVTVACCKELVVIDATTGKVRENRHLKDPGGHQSGHLSGLVCLSPDGKLVTNSVWKFHRRDVGEEQVVVKLFDARTAEVRATLDVADGLVSGLRFSPDGKTLACALRARTPRQIWGGIATSSLSEIRLFDVESGKNLQATFSTDTFEKQGVDVIGSLGWTPSGQLAVGRSSELAFWDPTTGERKARIFDPTLAFYWSSKISPDGRYVAVIKPSPLKPGDPTAGELRNEVVIWDIIADRKHATFKGHDKNIHSLVWSRDGQTLASAEKGVIRLWDVQTQKSRNSLPATAEYPDSWSISPDGKTVAAGQLFVPPPLPPPKPAPPKEGEEPVVPEPQPPRNPEWANPPRITPVTLWDVDTGKHRRLPVEAVSLTWSPDGKFIAYTDDKDTVRLWDVAAGREYAKLEVPARYHNWGGPSLAFSSDGRTLAFMSSQKTGDNLLSAIQLWDVASKKYRTPLVGHYSIKSLAWSHDGKTLASSSEFEVMLWDVSTAK